jgi:hypothetical protein
MKRSTSVVVVGLLVASVGANAYLLLRRRDGGGGGAGAGATARAGNLARADEGRPAAGPVSAGRMPGAAGTAGAGAASCEAATASLERTLAETQAQLEARLTIEDRYERDARSPDNEARMRPLMERLFAEAPAELGHDLECHGMICRVEVVLPESAPQHDWQMEIQMAEERRGLFGFIALQGGAPDQDPVTREMIRVESAYLEMVDPAVGDRSAVGDLMSAVFASPRVTACKTQHAAPGRLTVLVRFDVGAAGRRIALQYGGALADEPGGVCLRAVIDEIAAGIEVRASDRDRSAFAVDVP